MRRRITLVSVDAGAGHNCGLVQGLRNYGTVTTVYENKNPHGLDFMVTNAKYGYGNIPPRGDDLIIVGCLCFDRLRLRRRMFNNLGIRYENVHMIVTDGRFARFPEHYNPLFEGIDVHTTACKRHFRGNLPTKTYYQPFDLSEFDKTKNDKTTIAHSPFGRKKWREKGTLKIIRELERRDVEYDIITGVSWKDCLTRKAKAHIFVDQIDHYARNLFSFTDPNYRWPALGKSGIEALHLGCAVITYGAQYDTDIPAPPVAWVTKETFAQTLDDLIHSPDKCAELGFKGYEWALKYSNYDYAAKRVLGLN